MDKINAPDVPGSYANLCKVWVLISCLIETNFCTQIRQVVRMCGLGENKIVMLKMMCIEGALTSYDFFTYGKQRHKQSELLSCHHNIRCWTRDHLVPFVSLGVLSGWVGQTP